MMKKAIIFGDLNMCNKAYTNSQISQLNEIVDLHPEIIDQSDVDKYKAITEQAEIIYTASNIVNMSKEEVNEYFPKVKLLLYMGGTVKYFANGFLENGIEVVSGWVANGIPVAEFTAAQIMLCGRGFYRLNKIYKDEGYEAARKTALSYPGNRSAKIGILGAGAIGKEVIKLLQRVDAQIYVYDPFLAEKTAEQLNVVKADLDFIFENCDTISNHLANVPETVKILNEELFNRMKPNGIFINTARGAQVDADGLVKAMTDVPTRLALIDVTDPEEPLPENHPFLKVDNILITPHIAGTYEESYPLMFNLLREDTIRYIKGEPLVYAVKKEQLKTMA